MIGTLLLSTGNRPVGKTDGVSDMSRTAAEAAERYFQTWLARDFAGFSEVLAENVHFSGPLAEISGKHVLFHKALLQTALNESPFIKQLEDSMESPFLQTMKPVPDNKVLLHI